MLLESSDCVSPRMAFNFPQWSLRAALRCQGESIDVKTDSKASCYLLSDGLPFLHSVRSLVACCQNRVHLSQWENMAVLYKAARAVNLTGSQMHFFFLISVLRIRAPPTNPHIAHDSDLLTTSCFPISCQVSTQALWEQDAGPPHSVTQLRPFSWFLPRQREGHPQPLGLERTVMKFLRDTDDNFIF